MDSEHGQIEVPPLSEALGRRIVCDDGITRTVDNVCHSYQHKDRVIINERDPEDPSGYFVHMLSFSCQLLGKPLPTEEQKRAFTRVVRALRFQEDTRKSWRVGKNGLLMWS